MNDAFLTDDIFVLLYACLTVCARRSEKVPGTNKATIYSLYHRILFHDRQLFHIAESIRFNFVKIDACGQIPGIQCNFMMACSVFSTSDLPDNVT